MPRDRNQHHSADPNLIVGVFRDAETDQISMDPPIGDVILPSLGNGRIEVSGSRPLPGDLLERGDFEGGVDFQGDVDEMGIRKAVEKGKGIMASPRSLRPLLMTSSSLVTEGRDHSPSSSRFMRQHESGVHNNLVDQIMDGL